MLNYFISKYIVYFKFVQWINFEQELPIYFSFLNPLLKFFEKFSNNAPYIDDDINYEALNKIQKKITFNLIPINSGTISLVFKGIINETGEKVAIKVLRNGIEKKISNCIDNVYYLVHFAKYLPFLSSIDPDKYFDEIKGKLILQSNFSNEIESIKYFHKSLKHCKYSDSIKCYEELCTDNIIVMNYVSGKTIYELTSEERKSCLKTYIKFLTYSLFIKKVMHLDSHPGNLLFTNEPNYKICLLDLGMTLTMNDEERDFIRDFHAGIENKNFEDILICVETHKITLFNKEDISEFIVFLKDAYKKKIIFSIFKLKNSIKDIHFLFDSIKDHKYELNGNIRRILLGLISNVSLLLYFEK